MRKSVSSLSLYLILVLALAAPAGAASYKIGNVLAPTHPFNVALFKFAEEVKAQTGGRVQFEVLHSGVIGGDVEMLSQVVAGSLDSAVIAGVSVFQNFNKKSGVEELPFLFPDLETARRAYDGEFGQMINDQIIAPLGLVPLGYMENGLRHFTNNKRPIVLPADMKGIKFRSGVSPIRLQMFSILGAQAVSMAFPELFTGLQQGTVDGQENPLAIIYSSKFNEVQKYLSLSGHIYNSAPVIFNKKIWEKMSAADQALVRRLLAEAIAYERELNGAADRELRAKLAESGMQINEIDRAAFLKAMEPVYASFKKQFGPEFIEAAAKAAEQ